MLFRSTFSKLAGFNPDKVRLFCDGVEAHPHKRSATPRLRNVFFMRGMNLNDEKIPPMKHKRYSIIIWLD